MRYTVQNGLERFKQPLVGEIRIYWKQWPVFSVEKPQAGASCQLFAGADGTKEWIFQGVGQEKRPSVFQTVISDLQ